jgi:hypothetical protein
VCVCVCVCISQMPRVCALVFVYLLLLISFYHAGVCGGSSGCDDAARHFEEPFLSLLPSEEKKIEPLCVRCVCVCVCVCVCSLLYPFLGRIKAMYIEMAYLRRNRCTILSSLSFSTAAKTKATLNMHQLRRSM